MTSPSDASGPAGTPADPAAASAAPAGVPAAPPSPTTVAARQHKVRRTRVGGVWVGLTLAAIVLLLLLVFILENGQRVTVSYFGAHGHLPLGVALLLAAVAGALLVASAGTARILQLRRTARRHRKVDVAAAQASTAPVAASPVATSPEAVAPAQPPGDQA